MTTPADITLKVGDTLIADCTYHDANGVPVNLDTAGITINSAVSFADGIGKAVLEVTPADQAIKPGQYRIRGDSRQWPAGQRIRWDVRYTRGQDSFSTRTIYIQMLERIS
jgi:hypothetical protein